MQLFLILLLTHLAGDFLLQPPSWVKDKMEKKIRSVKLLLHILVHAVLLALLLFLLEYREQILPIVLVTVATHYLIDLAKIYLHNEKNLWKWFVADQLLHLGVIIALAQYFEPFISLNTAAVQRILGLAICLILLTRVSSFIIKNLISKWSPAEEDNASLKNAGHFIGILERFFVFIFIITGHWEAIGFLIAAKSVFRFGDLREAASRQLTEYILIGTLLSFGFAILIGLLYQYMVYFRF